MVKHIVLWKLRDDDQKQKNMDHMIDILTSLVGKIEGLVSMEMGYNFNTNNDYDVVLYATFKNAAALKYYQNHPEHIKCKEFIHSVIVSRTAADYFFEEGVKAAKPFNEVPDAPAAPESFDLKAALTAAMKKSEADPLSIKLLDSENTTVPTSVDTSTKPTFTPAPPVAPPPPFTPPVIEQTPFTPNPSVVPPVAPPPFTPPVASPVVEPPKAETTKPKFTPAPPVAPSVVEPPKAETTKPKFTTAPVTPPVAPPVAPVENIKETKDIFGKKKLQVDVTPLDQRSDTWTCPSCGKIMPNYVGTCGCGEPKPFAFDDVPPALQPDTSVKPSPSAYPTKNAAPTSSAPKSAPVESIKEIKDIFGKKKLQVDVTPLEQRSDTWTCPSCGKIMPNYVGTCGCGEPKPFAFDDVPPALQPDTSVKPSPSAYPQKKTETQAAPPTSAQPFKRNPRKSRMPELSNDPTPEDQIISDTTDFNNAGPSIESYSPQTKPNNPATDPAFNFIKNDDEQLRTSPKPFGRSRNNNVNQQQPPHNSFAPADNSDDDDNYVSSFNFDDIPDAAPMCADDSSYSSSFNFDDIPDTAPMRFSDAPPERIIKTNVPPAPPKHEKKSLFGGKKAKEAEALRQAEEMINNRKDIPDGGTWTCPNCGKVMPSYVGTCGCGESKPFEF